MLSDLMNIICIWVATNLNPILELMLLYKYNWTHKMNIYPMGLDGLSFVGVRRLEIDANLSLYDIKHVSSRQIVSIAGSVLKHPFSEL